jgi:hypothetical protein
MPGKAQTDLQEDRLVLGQLVENWEGQWEDRQGKGPVQQRSEQLQSSRLAVEDVIIRLI